MVYHPFITTCKKDLEYCKAILIFLKNRPILDISLHNRRSFIIQIVYCALLLQRNHKKLEKTKKKVIASSSCVTITLQVYPQILLIFTLSSVTKNFKWQSLFLGPLSQIHSKRWLENLSTTCINSLNDWVISPRTGHKGGSPFAIVSKPAMGKCIVQNSSILKILQGWTLRSWIRQWNDSKWSGWPW